MNYNNIRRQSKKINVGGVEIGGDARIAIQSMTNTDTANAKATVEQIKALERVGCDIIRIAVPDLQSAETVKAIKDAGVKIPVVADIHYDYKIALRCAELGIDKISTGHYMRVEYNPETERYEIPSKSNRARFRPTAL